MMSFSPHDTFAGDRLLQLSSRTAKIDRCCSLIQRNALRKKTNIPATDKQNSDLMKISFFVLRYCCVDTCFVRNS